MAVQNNKLPVPTFNFNLWVEAVYNVPCKSIGAFEKKNEYEYIQEGGLNDYVHMRRKPISTPFTFEVERYMGINDARDYLDPLANGTELVLPIILIVRRNPGSEGVRTYLFTGCVVMGKKYGELNAEKSELLTEITTIGYREMFCLETPYTSDISEWKFDGTSKEGKKGTGSAKHVSGEKTKAEMEALAVKWPAASSAVTNKQTTKKEMEAQAVKWPAASSATTNKQTTKKEMEAQAVKWPAASSAVTNKQTTKKEMEAQAAKWPDTSSAVTNKQTSQKEMEAQAVKWPDTSSAVTTEQTSKSDMEAQAVKWPDTSSAVTTEQTSKSDMEAQAVRWPPTQSAVITEQTSKSDMESRAVRWPPTRSAYDIATFLGGGYSNT